MLDLAHEVKKAGRDVVVGYIERHAREETLALLEGFEILPVKKVIYKNITLTEFDLQAALERKPDLILIDELAHTNSGNLVNEKRYQDVKVLLEHGIDVYTTLNIQHIESIRGKVKEIAKVKVTEGVPDSMLKLADNVELIDMEPEELISRINQGKVYKREKIDIAKENFFTIDNLTKLREIALQYMINTVDRKSISITKKQYILFCLEKEKIRKENLQGIYEIVGPIKQKWILYLVVPFLDYGIKKDRKKEKELQKRIEEEEGNYQEIEKKNLIKEIEKITQEKEISKIYISKTLLKNNPFILYKMLYTFSKYPIQFIWIV